eukprot:13373862-Ditylum_brightwellii.AAC.1
MGDQPVDSTKDIGIGIRSRQETMKGDTAISTEKCVKEWVTHSKTSKETGCPAKNLVLKGLERPITHQPPWTVQLKGREVSRKRGMMQEPTSLEFNGPGIYR